MNFYARGTLVSEIVMNHHNSLRPLREQCYKTPSGIEFLDLYNDVFNYNDVFIYYFWYVAQAHVDSSPTPPPVMAAPVGSNLQSSISGNATGFGTGQFSTQIVTSQTSAVSSGLGSSAPSAASTNVTHTIVPTGNSSQSVPSTLPTNAPAPTGGGTYSSSSPSNP